MQNFRFKKSLGQNFIKDDSIVEKMVNEGKLLSNSIVIEVGPGEGILTKQLSKSCAHVLCYELDLELEYHLIELQKKLGNVDVIFGDFLDRNISEDIAKYKYEHIYFVSNVPYYITTPILMKIIESNVNFEKVIIMVQEEVGERIAASFGHKAYSSLTVFLNYFYDIKKLFKVNRHEFIPIPNVDSEVVMLTKKDKELEVVDKDFFFGLVKDSFKFKRKNLRNNLKKYDLEIIENVLRRHNLSLMSRAEQVPIEVFAELSNELK